MNLKMRKRIAETSALESLLKLSKPDNNKNLTNKEKKLKTSCKAVSAKKCCTQRLVRTDSKEKYRTRTPMFTMSASVLLLCSARFRIIRLQTSNNYEGTDKAKCFKSYRIKLKSLIDVGTENVLYTYQQNRNL